MDDSVLDSNGGRSSGGKPVERLLVAIGYPERMSGDSSMFKLRVDGVEVVAEVMDGRLVLSHALSDDDTILPKLASYAAGRMLAENATLAYGDGRAILWQDASVNADAHTLRRLFETFMDSCDWWRARVDALRGDAADAESVPETMMIRP